MLILMALTIYQYKNIRDFISNSTDHSIVIKADPQKISELKLHLEKMTYQPVELKPGEGESSKLIIKCPPEKFMLILRKLKEENYNIEE